MADVPPGWSVPGDNPPSPPPPPYGFDQPPPQPPPYGSPPPPYGYQQQQQPWGYGPPGQMPYGYAPRTEGTAIGALISAIASFVVCPVVPAVIALVLAAQATTKIQQSQGMLTGDGMVTAARAIAFVNIGLVVLAVVGIVLVVAVGGRSSNGY